ncbi:hypothetical protein A8135_02385 [Legionella jamestowniensis]|uniref:F-box domain-containing protein n=1 Tax=Legionella jamestowniensis TaxID=455 RepID=A0ABX2XTE4_9GAMM|nr:hypothetical protein [Legionella jamestowniensis]OCH97707.1 hypothetical protein A8135_02385 [Legionella jamestowniensis]
MYINSLLTKFFKNDESFNKLDDYLPRECWLNILEYLQKDREINTLRLVSTEMQRATTLTKAGRKYYQRKDNFFNTYKKIKAVSQRDNNYELFFVSHLKTQVAIIKEQLITPSNTFSLYIYFDNSLQSDKEKAYLAQQLGTWGAEFISSQIRSITWYNYPSDYFNSKGQGSSYWSSNKTVKHIVNSMDSDAKLSSIYNHVILIFTIEASESNHFIQSLVEQKNKYQSKLPFIIIVSLNPLIKLEDFQYPILKLFSISPGYREKLADIFFLNNIHPDLWTNTSYRYEFYYRRKMENIAKEISNLFENLINIKESLQTHTDNQHMNGP